MWVLDTTGRLSVRREVQMNVFPEGTYWQTLPAMPNDPIHIGNVGTCTSYRPAFPNLVESKNDPSAFPESSRSPTNFFFFKYVANHISSTSELCASVVRRRLRPANNEYFHCTALNNLAEVSTFNFCVKKLQRNIRRIPQRLRSLENCAGCPSNQAPCWETLT